MGYEVPGCEKRGLWKTRCWVVNAGSGGKRALPFFRHDMNDITKIRSQIFFRLYCDEYQFSIST